MGVKNPKPKHPLTRASSGPIIQADGVGRLAHGGSKRPGDYAGPLCWVRELGYGQLAVEGPPGGGVVSIGV